MEQLKHKILSAAAGVSGGLAGLVALARCSGNSCTACYGCAGVGAGIALAALVSRWKGRRKNHGVA